MKRAWAEHVDESPVSSSGHRRLLEESSGVARLGREEGGEGKISPTKLEKQNQPNQNNGLCLLLSLDIL